MNKYIKSTLVYCSVLSAVVPAISNAQDSNDELAEAEFERIVISGKLKQSLRNATVSVSILNEDTLKDLNAQSLSDYITRVPGVVFNDYQPGVSEVVIRGVASTTYHEANQATTGYYLNEIPLIEPGFPLVIPDVDSFDLQRVEVLRGPQGTLFGSSSLGGAVNYVVNEADVNDFDMGIETMLSSTSGVDQKNHAIKGMVNMPIIEDKLALRLVGFQRFDSGYLDNKLLGEDGSNDLTVEGLRGSLVFTPSESTTISATMMSQEYNLEDQTYVIFNDDPETFERNTNVAEHQLTDFKLFSLRLEQELPFATFTAIASSVEKTGDLAFDYSIFGGNDPRTDTPLLAFGLGESSTDFLEFRLASKNVNTLEWQVGVNLTNLESKSTSANYIEGIADYVDSNPDDFDDQAGSVLAPDDFAERTDSSNDVSEKAIFGELTYHMSEALSLTVGGRLFEYEISNTLDFLPNTDLIEPFSFTPDEADENGFIPKIAVSYDINDDFLIYSSYSEGFRIGGVNVFSAANTDLPLTFNSDSTSNFEIGTKFELFNGKAKFDATVYHIEWDDIQARLYTPGDYKAYTVNGGGADINGIELTIDLQLTEALRFNTSMSYNDAELSDVLPDTFAVGGGYASGTQLPGASDLILASTITMNLDGEMEPTISLSHRYLSKAPVAFGASLEKGGYNIVDLNATAMISDEMQASIFIKNLGDTYGILSAPFSFAGSVTRPRTLGASFKYSF